MFNISVRTDLVFLLKTSDCGDISTTLILPEQNTVWNSKLKRHSSILMKPCEITRFLLHVVWHKCFTHHI